MSDIPAGLQAQITIAKDPPPGFALHERYDVSYARAAELIAAGVAALVEVRPQNIEGVGRASDDLRKLAEARLLALTPPPPPPETIVIVDEPPQE